MNDPTRQEDFEVYPYAEEEPSDPVLTPPPAAPVVSRASGPVVSAPGPGVSGPGGVGRRGVLLGAIGAGVLGLFGLAVVRRNAGGEPEFGGGGAWAEETAPEEETVGDVVAALQTADGDLFVDVPGDWEVLSEFELLHLRHAGGAQLVARIPDRPARSSESQLRIEADYTRTRFDADFTPDPDAEVSRDDNPPFERFTLRSSGTWAGEDATELVDYQVDTDRERAIVVSALWSQGSADLMEQSVAIAQQLLDGFQLL